jgi:hypothetical protein
MTALSQQTTANGWMVPVLRPAVKHFWGELPGVGRQPTPAFALPTVYAGHASGCGPSQTSDNVLCSVAIGGKADFARPDLASRIYEYTP